ncbi:hypothetical protein KEM48_010922 [Puccinia striiformis f. sp. tritici PST-130]|nr:hypothetical protein KEM48_010922 [Puccinia striiformis f. sp. tritici PST-130]
MRSWVAFVLIAEAPSHIPFSIQQKGCKKPLFEPYSEEISQEELKELIERSYSTFRHPEIAPLKKLTENRYVVELWHGLTFTFSDVALQFLGNLFEFFLNRKNQRRPSKDIPAERITVVRATSGNTGSAISWSRVTSSNSYSIWLMIQEERIKISQAKVQEWMIKLKTTGHFKVPDSTLQTARAIFGAGKVDDEQTKQTILQYFNGSKDVIQDAQRYIVDPHTAVGLFVAEKFISENQKDEGTIVQAVLLSAHPAKFSEAVTQSIVHLLSPPEDFDFERDILPIQFQGLLNKPRKVIDVHGINIVLTKNVIIQNSPALDLASHQNTRKHDTVIAAQTLQEKST